MRIRSRIAMISAAAIAAAAHPAPSAATNMRTFVVLSAGGAPAEGSISFTACYNGDDSCIETEDSYNNTENAGWYSAVGYCRTNSAQVNPPVNPAIGDSYRIWITAAGEAGSADGTVAATSPAYTSPGTAADPLVLGAASYLAAPGGVSATAGNGHVVLGWEPVPGATEYRIYRNPVQGNPNKVYERVAVVDGGSPAGWTDWGVANGTAYGYLIVAAAPGKRSGHTAETVAQPSEAYPTATPTPPPSVTPEATPSPSATPTPTPTRTSPPEPTATPTFPPQGIRVNFQPASAARPSGYEPDGGSPYTETDDWSYGWR